MNHFFKRNDYLTKSAVNIMTEFITTAGAKKNGQTFSGYIDYKIRKQRGRKKAVVANLTDLPFTIITFFLLAERLLATVTFYLLPLLHLPEQMSRRKLK